MENLNNPLRPTDNDTWLAKDLTEDIHVDPHADSQFIRPEDLELERILREHHQAVMEEETAANLAQVISEEVAPAPAPAPAEVTPPAATPASAPVRMPAATAERRTAAPKKRTAATPSKASATEKALTPRRKTRKPLKETKKDPLGLPQLAATIIWLALILAIGFSIGRTLWAACTDVFAFGKAEYSAIITITEDDDIDDIAAKLHDAHLIRYPKLFRLFAVLTDKDERISIGSFSLNSQLDYNAMINAMTANAEGRREVEIMLPEGYTCVQIFEKLEETGVCKFEKMERFLTVTEADAKNDATAKQLYDARNALKDDYWFLEGVEMGKINSLEGFLFPDTYEFYEQDDPERIIRKFLNAFDARFTDKMREDFEAMKLSYANALRNRGYSEEYIIENGLTLHKVVIIASMIEKETAHDLESYTISSVIYNRLTRPDAWPFLGIDATLVYGLNGKTELTVEDLESNHPYNTRTQQGLPPGPISNPGSNSLAAAVKPEATEYFYYALDPKSGEHRFFTQYQENEFYNFLNSI